ncbi:MAG: hypothetical protein AAGJ68_11265 [Pseudomonadota bacterium]
MTDSLNAPETNDFGDLNELWQDSGPVDTAPLIDRLKRHNQRLRRLNQISFAVCVGALVITAAMEFLGRIPTNGLLTLIGFVAIIGSWWKYRRDKAKLVAAYSEEPEKLLPFLIKRTKAARNLGRYYYSCSFPSVIAGYMWARLSDDGGTTEVSSWILMPLVMVGFACLIGTTVFGVHLARQKTRELKELQAMLATL